LALERMSYINHHAVLFSALVALVIIVLAGVS
jgi:hypothetical protein